MFVRSSLFRTALLLVLVGLLSLATSCPVEDNAIVDKPLLKGVISLYNKYDGAHPALVIPY